MTSLPQQLRLLRCIRLAGVITLSLAVALLVAAAVVPIRATGVTSDRSRHEAPAPLPLLEEDLESLLARTAGSSLIRPAQVQAAVRDTGLAQRLLSKLRLIGVVQMGDETVAYLQIENQPAQSVRKGDRVLEFVIEAIESGKVTLSLEGVQVELRH